MPEQSIVPYDTAYTIFLESIVEVNEYASKRDVGLLIENNVVTPIHMKEGKKDTFLMVRATEIKKLMDDVNDDNLGLLVDTGHLNVTANAFGYDRLDFLEETKPYIKAFHLSDNDAKKDQNLQLNDEFWILPHLKEFTNSVMILEVYNLTPEGIKKQLGLIDNYIN